MSRTDVPGQVGQVGQRLGLWLTRDEVCQRLGISVRTLRRKVAAGAIEHQRDGVTYLYRVVPDGGAKGVPKPARVGRPRTGTGATNDAGTGGTPPAEGELARAMVEALVKANQEVGELRARVAQLEGELETLRSGVIRVRPDGRRQRLVTSSGPGKPGKGKRR